MATQTQSASEPWATARIALRPGRIEREDLASAADALDALGALLAEHDAVGGVETRDPSTAANAPGFVVVERPELVVYTRPEFLSDVERRASELCTALGIDAAIESRVRDDDDWRDRWKEFYQPRVFGQGSLLIRPSWVERRPDDPELELIIDPGRAFGTGLHESTSLCQQAIVALAERGVVPDSVLDVGCGSGILGLMAARLFANASVEMFDLDEDAVATTRENAIANALGDRVSSSVSTPESRVGPACALVLANIRPNVLIPSADAIASAVAPGGHLLLSGILDPEAESVRAAYDGRGLQLIEDATLNDWTMLLYRRDASNAGAR